MVVTGLMFVGVQATVKAIGDAVPPAEASFLRYFLGLVFLIPMARSLRSARVSKGDWGRFAARGFVQAVGVILWFFAMTQISLAEITAINYLSPIYVTIGAALFLGETLAMRRIVAVMVALLGALIILRPGVREIGAGHLAMLGTSLCFGISYLMAKSLSSRNGPEVVVAMLSVFATIALAPFAVMNWVTPTFGQLAALLLVAAFATGGHYTMTLAFRAAPVSVTQPAAFLQLVWSVILGLLMFDEAIDPWVVLGGVVIVAAISFISWREARSARRSVTPSPLQTKS
ncbi:DMT family transporter [Qingshengfaniella alkalisoli]|uniref:DMT family transporter n=2 Tax=Qingshengfaniella alkalisoli TaxID=2599296 RepID=A0A5B8I8V5_9RHOB|nr:DMT family transporter [Qingshengfaniella alkalisoli]